MAIVFELARPAQRDGVLAILTAAFAQYAEKVGYELTSQTFAWLDKAIAEGQVYAGMDGGRLVGVVATSREDGAISLDYVATDPARQGDGIGSQLIAGIEEKARRAGAKALVLHTAEIRQDLLGFYRRHGFVETGRALPAHGKDTHLRVHMRKDL